MSRTKTQNLSRESVWPSSAPSSDHLGYLEDCISATEGCLTTLSNCLGRLNPGIEDLPRLSKVLKSEHHFLVLPNTTIQTHLTNLSASLAPQINQLMVRAEDLVEHERDRVKTLEQTLKLLQSSSSSSSRSQSQSQSEQEETGDEKMGENDEAEEDRYGSKIESVEMKGLNVMQRRKIMMLRNKRDRLEKERIKSGLGVGED